MSDNQIYWVSCQSIFSLCRHLSAHISVDPVEFSKKGQQVLVGQTLEGMERGPSLPEGLLPPEKLALVVKGLCSENPQQQELCLRVLTNLAAEGNPMNIWLFDFPLTNFFCSKFTTGRRWRGWE